MTATKTRRRIGLSRCDISTCNWLSSRPSRSEHLLVEGRSRRQAPRGGIELDVARPFTALMLEATFFQSVQANLTGEGDVRKILASALCQACGIFRARDGGVAGEVGRPEVEAARDRHAPRQFSERFYLGHRHVFVSDRRRRQVKTAAAVRSGTPLLIRPARSRDRSNADRANDHYHRYKGRRSADRGIGGKGLSIFDRVAAGVSLGDGAPNPKGLDFYDRLVDELL